MPTLHEAKCPKCGKWCPRADLTTYDCAPCGRVFGEDRADSIRTTTHKLRTEVTRHLSDQDLLLEHIEWHSAGCPPRHDDAFQRAVDGGLFSRIYARIVVLEECLEKAVVLLKLVPPNVHMRACNYTIVGGRKSCNCHCSQMFKFLSELEK